MWHLAHSAAPTNFEREAADLVGHQPGDSMRSSVGSEMPASDDLDELGEERAAR